MHTKLKDQVDYDTGTIQGALHKKVMKQLQKAQGMQVKDFVKGNQDHFEDSLLFRECTPKKRKNPSLHINLKICSKLSLFKGFRVQDDL